MAHLAPAAHLICERLRYDSPDRLGPGGRERERARQNSLASGQPVQLGRSSLVPSCDDATDYNNNNNHFALRPSVSSCSAAPLARGRPPLCQIADRKWSLGRASERAAGICLTHRTRFAPDRAHIVRSSAKCPRGARSARCVRRALEARSDVGRVRVRARARLRALDEPL